MGPVLNKLQRATRRFRRRDDGSATIEALFWIPAFIAVFALIVDLSLLYHYEARILRVIQDANRNFSITRYETEAEVETAIINRLASIKVTDVTVDATIYSDATATRNNFIITNVTVPAKHLRMFGLYSAISNSNLVVTGLHVAETAEFDFFDSFSSVPTT